MVTQVEPNSPGAKAGLKVGDVITELNGKSVADSGSLQVEVGQQQPGTKLQLNVLREGKPVSLSVTLEGMNKNDRGDETADASKGKPRWGIGLADLSADARQQLQAGDSVRGAVVAKVVPGSPADNAGLQPGDIIVEVNRHPVQSASDVQKALSSVENGSDAMVLVWSRGGSSSA